MKPVWPWIFGIIPSVLALYIAKRDYPWWGSDAFEKWFPVFVGVFITGLATAAAIALGCWLSGFIGERCDQVWVQGWHGKLVSLRGADGLQGGVSGSMFVVVGHIESSQVYFYYTLQPNGSFRAHKWFPDQYTSIFEEDRQDGEVIQFRDDLKKPWQEWFAISGGDLRMDFHIPKGSIQQKFTLN